MESVQTMVVKAKKLIEKGRFEDAVDVCLDIVKCEGRSYLGHVLFGALHLGQNRFHTALQHYQQAIFKDPEKIEAWQGVGKVFEHYGDMMKDEMPFLRETFNKIMDFHNDNEGVRQQEALRYQKMFKRLDDSRGIFLSSAALLVSPNFSVQDEEIKHWVSVNFVASSEDAGVKHENATLNKALQRTCKYLMAHELTDEATMELAWSIYFKSKNRCTDVRVLWILLTEECPRPFCTFNVERILLIFMETYPDHELVEVIKFHKKMPAHNNVNKLFGTMMSGDRKELIETILQVLRTNKYLIIGYLRLCVLFRQIGNYKNALIAAKAGLKLMKHFAAIYHISYFRMVGLFHLELNYIWFYIKGDVESLNPNLTIKEARSQDFISASTARFLSSYRSLSTYMLKDKNKVA